MYLQHVNYKYLFKRNAYFLLIRGKFPVTGNIFKSDDYFVI